MRLLEHIATCSSNVRVCMHCGHCCMKCICNTQQGGAHTYIHGTVSNSLLSKRRAVFACLPALTTDQKDQKQGRLIIIHTRAPYIRNTGNKHKPCAAGSRASPCYTRVRTYPPIIIMRLRLQSSTRRARYANRVLHSQASKHTRQAIHNHSYCWALACIANKVGSGRARGGKQFITHIARGQHCRNQCMCMTDGTQ